MNTPAHILIGAAAGGRGGQGRLALAGGLGGLLPDLSLYVLTAHAVWWQGMSMRVVFDRLYFSDAWQAVFAVDNSIPLWAGVLGLALWWRAPRAAALALGGLLHVAADLLLHNEDARAHFQPFTGWVFRSPVSYWDSARHADIVGPAETLLCLGLALWLWRCFPRPLARAAVALLLIGQLAPALIWGVLLA